MGRSEGECRSAQHEGAPVRFGAMILAAGRGERMRPLSDACPKPLLAAGGRPLIHWQIDALREAGFTDIVVNASHLAQKLVDALGDGSALGVRIAWSLEPVPLETAGGIATALPLLPAGPALVVSGDVWSRFDYASLLPRMRAMAADAAPPRAYLVMVPNPPFHPQGDFALRDGRVYDDNGGRLTFGSIGVFDTALFRGLPRGEYRKLRPLFEQWIAAGIVSGERWDGPWANVGTPADLALLDAALAAQPKDS